MTYARPQLTVHQQLADSGSSATPARYACVIGPDYRTKTYAANHDNILVGKYAGQEIGFAWPYRDAGALVDQDYTRIFLEKAWLNFASLSCTVPSGGDGNRVTAAINLVDVTGFARASTLLRDVRVGDGVRISGTGTDSKSYSIDTSVLKMIAESVAATVGTATADSDNQAAGTLTSSVTLTDGESNDITTTATATTYDGVKTGHRSETYVITVVTGGAPSAARLRVTSASGTDNQASVVPAAWASPTAIGTRGLTVTFGHTDDDEFVVGQEWTALVSQAYTKPTAAATGTYAGTDDATYIVTVTTGGDLAASTAAARPAISVITNKGTDASGPTILASGTAVAIGSYGLTFSLTGTKVNKGEVWTIPVTAASNGAVRTVALSNILPTALAGQTVSVDFCIIENLELPALNPITGNTRNFNGASTEVVLADVAGVTTSQYVNLGGVEQALPVLRADVFVQYRALQQDYVESATSFTSAPDQVVVENDLCYAISKMRLNSGDYPVLGIAVKTNDLAGYTYAIEQLVGRPDVYAITALTQDPAILELVSQHTLSMSTAETSRWREAFLNKAANSTVSIYAGQLATIAEDPNTSGTQYTRVEVDGGQFITNGVRAGDIVRCRYSTDNLGVETFESYQIDRVVSEEVVMLMSGPASAVDVPSKMTVVRELSRADLAKSWAQGWSSNNRRLMHVWPDTAEVGDRSVPGYFLCAAIAALRCASYSHAPLTNVEINGFDSVRRTTEFMSDAELDVMASNGVWVVTQDPTSGAIITRHAITSGPYAAELEREESYTSNLDYISRIYHDTFKSYIGRCNNTEVLLSLIERKVANINDVLTASVSEELGPRLITAKITGLYQHSLYKDRAVLQMAGTLPGPLNNFDIYLVAD